jgi:hypothetical protein
MMSFDLSKYMVVSPELKEDIIKNEPATEEQVIIKEVQKPKKTLDNYQKSLVSLEEQNDIPSVSSLESIGLIDGFMKTYDKFYDEVLPSIENYAQQLAGPDPSITPNQINPQVALQQYLRQMFFIRTNTKESDFTVYFQLSHDKIRDMFCHFFDTRLKSHSVHLIFGTAMSLKDQNPQQVWRLNSLISSMQLSQAGTIVGYALGWLDATETLLWAFCPERYIAEDSYAALTFDWNGFDYIASKKNIHRIDQQRYVDRFKSLGLLNDEECTNYMRGSIITLTADEVADRLRQNNKVEH